MRKNGFLVMWQLLALVKPLAHIMAFTITMGTLGFLSAIFIMVLGKRGNWFPLSPTTSNCSKCFTRTLLRRL